MAAAGLLPENRNPQQQTQSFYMCEDYVCYYDVIQARPEDVSRLGSRSGFGLRPAVGLLNFNDINNESNLLAGLRFGI